MRASDEARAELPEDLVRKIDVGLCWEWKAGRQGAGYGAVKWGDHMMLAHRVVYELLVGPIPQGLTLDHLCRNRACVNPDHLDPVTNKANILRGRGVSAINARKTHCAQGHAYDEENTGTSTDGRWCRACNRIRCRRRYARVRSSA